MSNPQIGFVAPGGPPPQYPGYPAQPQAHSGDQHQGVYPSQYQQQQPMYPGNQPFPPPIQQQPTYNSHQAVQWYNGNFQTYLTHATSFHVKQKVELLEALVGWETGNKYSVMDQAGNKIFYVGEESNVCGRQCFGGRRPFNLRVKDKAGQDVLLMDRDLDCSCFCGLLCADSLKVTAPGGQLLGTVVETFNILYPKFDIKDAGGNTVLRIEGPMCPLTFGRCSGPAVFRILNHAGASVGTISKEWGGLVREFFTDSDNFSISFPPDLDVTIKAVLMGGLFLIDFEFFEENGSDKRLFG